MDATASILTIVQVVFNVSRRLKNLTKETNAQEEEARRLQTAAEEYLWKIQHALSSSRDQGDLRYTSGTVPAKNEKIKRRLQEEVKSFRKDFEQLKEELESLEGEGKRQKIDLVLWGKNRVKPTFEKIKETIRNHQLELNLLLQLQQGDEIHEIRASIIALTPGQPSGQFREVNWQDLQRAGTAESNFSQAPTEVEPPSRKSSVQTTRVRSNETGRSSISQDGKRKSRDKADLPPLLRAVSEGSEARLKDELEQSADLQVRDKCEKTALHLAMQKTNCTVLIRLLLKYNVMKGLGLDINAVDDVDKTALHYCAEWDKSSAAKALLDHGAKFDILDMAKRTPLCWAIHKSYYDVIDLLLDRGAVLSEKHLTIKTTKDVKYLLLSYQNRNAKDDVPKKQSRKNSFFKRRESSIKA